MPNHIVLAAVMWTSFSMTNYIGHNYIRHNYISHKYIGARYAPLENPRLGGHFEYRHACTRAIDMLSAMLKGRRPCRNHIALAVVTRTSVSPATYKA